MRGNAESHDGQINSPTAPHPTHFGGNNRSTAIPLSRLLSDRAPLNAVASCEFSRLKAKGERAPCATLRSLSAH